MKQMLSRFFIVVDVYYVWERYQKEKLGFTNLELKANRLLGFCSGRSKVKSKSVIIRRLMNSTARDI